MIFVDTGGWFASTVPSDEDYNAAKGWLDQNHEPLLTTDFVIDETLTLFRARGEQVRALQIGKRFFSNALASVYYLTEQDISEAWQIFQKFSDKGWIFTDCTSKVVIEKLNITHAFAFDEHFQQFGTVIVVPLGQ